MNEKDTAGYPPDPWDIVHQSEGALFRISSPRMRQYKQTPVPLFPPYRLKPLGEAR